MKKSVFILCFLMSFQFQYAQEASKRDIENYNQYSQLVEQNENTYNYTQQEMESFRDAYKNIEDNGQLSSEASSESHRSTNSPKCEIQWQDIIYGTCIGQNNSLIPFDFGNDGTIELIANARNGGFNNGTGYWYILKYNNILSKYEKVYVSEMFEEGISKMTLVDLHDDGNMELIGAGKERIFIIDLSDMSTIRTIDVDEIDDYFGIVQVRYADADNDGDKEIVASSRDEFVIINDESWEVESYFEMEAGDFAIGNIDGDPMLETVFTHGSTFEINSQGEMTEELDFRPDANNYDGYIELSDVDGDGYLEAIIANSWYSLVIYDVDLTSPKYEIQSDLDIDAFSMIDVNNDGKKEILYGDGQWGKIYAHNASNGAKLWEIDNPEHGTTGIAMADFDGDGTTEVVWGAGCSSSGSDHLFFHNAANLQFEWQSTHNDGPFYAIEIADVDQDGKEEIITISYQSESGYDSGFLTVYDAETKSIEFESDGDFLNNNWTGIYNFEIADHGNDGDLDIIVAAGVFYDAKIWVVDGNNYTIEAEHEYGFEDDISEFYALEVDDLDNDNKLEFLAVNEDRLYIINSEDFSVEWSSVAFSGNAVPHGVFTGNLDDDPGKEIVVCKGYIYRIDDANYTQLQSVYGEYTAIRLYDWNEDGKMEILAGSLDGFVHVLDGITLEILETFTINSKPIGGVEMADLNADGIDEIVVTSNSQVFFLTRNGKQIESQMLIQNLGQYDGIVAKDYDGDGIPNIVLGTDISILELNLSCTQCLWFEAVFEGDPATCGEDNGAIIGTSSDPSASFVLLNYDQEFNEMVEDLAPGEYQLTAVNDLNCMTEATVVIEDLDLKINLSKQDKSCFGDDDGSANINVLEGGLPLTILWSTGESSASISDLGAGDYFVSIVDNNGCEFADSFQVEQSMLLTTVMVDKPSCEGSSNGEASLEVDQGAGGYTYYWDSVLGTNMATDLSIGNHQVSVVDALGCESIHDFYIDSTRLEVEAEQISASCNGDQDGSAAVNILEGKAPYNYQWSGGISNSSLINNVSSGTYFVTVTDANECQSIASVTIDESVLTLETSSQDLECHDDMDGSAVVFVTEGVAPYTYQWQDGSTMSSISNLSAGDYFVLVKDSAGCTVIENIEISSPPPLEAGFTIVPDDMDTPEFEGSIQVVVTGGTSPYFFNWENGNTTDMINQLENGFYNLLITDANECRLDTLVEVSPITSTSEIINDHTLVLFPNPNVGAFTIESSQLDPIIDYELFTSTGYLIKKVVGKSYEFEGNYTFDFSDLNKGMYSLLITSNNKLYVKRFTIVD